MKMFFLQFFFFNNFIKNKVVLASQNYFNMLNRIPISLLSKMGQCEIELQGENVKVSVVDAKINELQSSLKALPRRVVGLGVKIVPVESTQWQHFNSLCWDQLLGHPSFATQIVFLVPSCNNLNQFGKSKICLSSSKMIKS